MIEYAIQINGKFQRMQYFGGKETNAEIEKKIREQYAHETILKVTIAPARIINIII